MNISITARKNHSKGPVSGEDRKKAKEIRPLFLDVEAAAAVCASPTSAIAKPSR